MARPAKSVSYSLVKVKKQKLVDPYVSHRGLVPVGGTLIVDEAQADFLESCGMCDIVKEDVLPPWNPKFSANIYDNVEEEGIAAPVVAAKMEAKVIPAVKEK